MKKIWFVISLVACLFSMLIPLNAEEKEKRIIIDPGHGGKDGGAEVGKIKESDLNLEIAFVLKSVFEENGYYVDLTRSHKGDLCSGEFIKKDDLNARINIINSGEYLFAISIHQNTFSNPIYKGSQVFYSNANKANKELSTCVMNSIKSYLKNTSRSIVNRSNILLLNKVSIPCCLIECGFLTNHNELAQLQNKDYQTSLSYAIYNGCNDFLKQIST